MPEPAPKPARPSVFRRHPRLTLVGVNLCAGVLLFGLDWGLARLFVERPSGRVADPWFHHGLAPDYSDEVIWGTSKAPLITDNLGLRSASRGRTAPVGRRPRLLFLGDSFTEGVGVRYEETFVGRLAAALPAYEVLNGGVTSHSPLLYRLHLQDLVEHRHLAVSEVVVFLDISDPQDEICYRSFRPSLTPERTLGERLHQYLRWHSFVYFEYDCYRMMREYGHPVDDVARALPPPARGDAATADEWREPAGFRQHFRAERAYWETSPVWESWGRHGLELATRNMAALVQFCAAHQIKLSVAVYPWATPHIAERRLPARQELHWQEFCRQQALPFLDLFPAFITAMPPDETIARYVIPGDVHWNAAGHALVAERFLAWWPARAPPAP